MTLLPTCLALPVGVVRLMQLRKGSYKARRERLYGSKMVITHAIVSDIFGGLSIAKFLYRGFGCCLQLCI